MAVPINFTVYVSNIAVFAVFCIGIMPFATASGAGLGGHLAERPGHFHGDDAGGHGDNGIVNFAGDGFHIPINLVVIYFTTGGINRVNIAFETGGK